MLLTVIIHQTQGASSSGSYPSGKTAKTGASALRCLPSTFADCEQTRSPSGPVPVEAGLVTTAALVILSFQTRFHRTGPDGEPLTLCDLVVAKPVSTGAGPEWGANSVLASARRLISNDLAMRRHNLRTTST